jgi:hypothetical protein
MQDHPSRCEEWPGEDTAEHVAAQDVASTADRRLGHKPVEGRLGGRPWHVTSHPLHYWNLYSIRQPFDSNMFSCSSSRRGIAGLTGTGHLQHLRVLQATFHQPHGRTGDSIDAHLTIVFAALAVSRWIENVTGWSIRKLVKTARRYRTVHIQGRYKSSPPPTRYPANSAKPSKRSMSAAELRTSLAEVRSPAQRTTPCEPTPVAQTIPARGLCELSRDRSVGAYVNSTECSALSRNQTLAATSTMLGPGRRRAPNTL